jgi:hypothetical protein
MPRHIEAGVENPISVCYTPALIGWIYKFYLRRKDMADTKRIAVLVRDRKHEALRMAVGLTLADDEVNVFIMDDKLVPDEEIELNIETLGDMDAKIFSNNPENPYQQMSTEEISKALVDYDVVVPY